MTEIKTVDSAPVAQSPAQPPADPAPRERVRPEQLAYAAWLDKGMKGGLALLVVTYALYVLGLVEPHISLEDLPRYWALPVNDYLKAAGVGTGWSWVKVAHKGDFLNFVGIAFLAALTLACYVRILPFPFRSRDFLFGAILLLQLAVLVLAASGILVTGH